MRKHIDRALERRKNREIKVLRSWTDKRMDGSAIPGEAFGIGARCHSPIWQSPCMKSMDYHFSISPRTDQRLELVVDSYECSGRGSLAGKAWDVDQWDAEKIILSANFNRIGFRILSRIGRTLVAGRDVVMSDGVVVPGIRKEGGLHA